MTGADILGMKHRDKDHPDYELIDGHEKESAEELYSQEEEQQDRSALLDELRSQIQSGTYTPSIGRISVNIFGDLSGD